MTRNAAYTLILAICMRFGRITEHTEDFIDSLLDSVIVDDDLFGDDDFDDLPEDDGDESESDMTDKSEHFGPDE